MKSPRVYRSAFRRLLWVGFTMIGTGVATDIPAAASQHGASDRKHAAANRRQASRHEVQRALAGYNYILKTGKQGTVESVIVSGENGSGKDSRFTGTDRFLAAVNGAPSQRLPQPNVRLARKVQGKAAIEALGAQLPAVAAAHRMSEERFKEILLNDPTAWIDMSGRLFYVETPLPEIPHDQADGAPEQPTSAGPVVLDLSKTFLLHSRPGSSRVVYLDFNGHQVSRSAWNASFGQTNIDAQAFDLNANPASFDDDELTRIQNIWRRVAEDYAPFDIDVTTEEPPGEALERGSPTDHIFGSRVVITSSVFDCACGGIAYVGVFDYTGNVFKPAWVFYDMLGAGNEKNVAEAVSHEVGHNLGLSHDGSPASNYYDGHGSDATGWAPIMGVGYYKELTQWSLGEYPGANNREDDLSVMQSHGATLRADDAGDTTATAVTLAGAEAAGVFNVDQSSNIERRTDVDYFVFSTTGGIINLRIAPAALGPNLDISASLHDRDGGLIAASNPADTLDATIASNLAAGTYYLKIDGVGKLESASDSGYSDYGSVGQYRITGTLAKSANQAPIAVAAASPLTGKAPLKVAFSSSGSRDDGVIAAYNWKFGDGVAASNQPNPEYTFTAAGTYPVMLTVVDSAGLTGNATVTITVQPAPSATAMRVEGMAISLFTNSMGTRARASVTVANGLGQPVANAMVNGTWNLSGVVAGYGSAMTNSQGVAVISSPIGSYLATYTFSVSGITRSGYTYDPDTNVLSSMSMTR